MPFGMGMTPPPMGPPQEDEWDSMSPLSQARGVDLMGPPSPEMQPDLMGGNLPSTNNPPWAQQLMGATSSPPPPQAVNAGGSALMEKKGPSTASKWLDTLAPILAGAAAVLGYKRDSAFGDTLMGVGKGFAEHLTSEAKQKRDLQAKSDTSTVDLAHKYLGEMPGDVDPEKYPGLAQMGETLREKLVNGQLSSPKEAQSFILEYTKYKEEIDQLKRDKEEAALKSKSDAPYQSFEEAFQGATGTDLMAPWMAKFGGGLVEDPKQPGRFVHPSELTAREATSRQGLRVNAEDARAEAGRKNAAEIARANRVARSGDVATRERGATARHKERLSRTGGGGETKQYDAAYKAATTHARALDSKRPISDPQKLQKDTLDYMAQSGHVVSVKLKNGKMGYYIGNGQVSDNRAEAEAIVKGQQLTMTPPPGGGEFEEDDSEIYE